MRSRLNTQKQIAVVIFSLYFIILILFGLLKFDGTFDRISDLHVSLSAGSGEKINIIPLKTMRTQWSNIGAMYAVENIFGNIAMFLPMGFFMEYFSRQNKEKIILRILLIILLFESVQYVFLIGFFDVDDILLNIIGSFIGMILYRIIIKWKEGKKNEEKNI